jgi:uncharacterized SAM-dependent methyltransferase
MYLKAKSPLPDILPGVGIAEGEEILMERSRKFTLDGLQQLAAAAGFYIPVEVHGHLIIPAKGHDDCFPESCT